MSQADWSAGTAKATACARQNPYAPNDATIDQTSSRTSGPYPRAPACCRNHASTFGSRSLSLRARSQPVMTARMSMICSCQIVTPYVSLRTGSRSGCG
ncbi:hypothetical protein ABE83_00185 [Streptomyces sp. CFMR 7]|nr:hypothetical protein ABE83_00185 [Streptomyces sp. CFMR 7]